MENDSTDNNENNELAQRELRKAGTINLQGKDYLQVAYRVKLMRLEHPEWSILTSFENLKFGEEVVLVARCCILGDRSHTLATAHKTVVRGGRGPAGKFPLEMAETGAIGRALAACGFGTLSGDLDEGEQLADAPTKRSW